MKRLSEIINEKKDAAALDDQWLNDEKPVKIKKGNQAIVLDIDMSKNPNIIKGQVKYGTNLVDYEWEDNGKCVSAKNNLGQNVMPDDDDTLIKSI